MAPRPPPGRRAFPPGCSARSAAAPVRFAQSAVTNPVQTVENVGQGLGTVLGVMDAFIGIASKGSGNLSAVAPGVAEALVTTVAGLAAAIPAVIAYNVFVNKLGLFAGELEGFANELVGSMAREGLL